MIDLRKPLEGAPGLLLLAALLLFGVTVGVAAALVWSWVEMKDSLANFLGGVVGAGLGAALAVMGAVYVQRRDLAERLRQPANTLRSALRALRRRLIVLDLLLQNGQPVGAALDGIEFAGSALPDGAELPGETHDAVVRLKLQMASLRAILEATGNDRSMVAGPIARVERLIAALASPQRLT